MLRRQRHSSPHMFAVDATNPEEQHCAKRLCSFRNSIQESPEQPLAVTHDLPSGNVVAGALNHAILSLSALGFFYIPRELRDKVYKHCIKAGELSIRCTCRLANDETLDMLGELHKHRSYGIEINFTSKVKSAHRGLFLEQIQFLNVTLILNGQFSSRPRCTLPEFGDHIKREACTATIKFEGPEMQFPSGPVIIFLRTLGVFNSVILKTEAGMLFHPKDRRIAQAYGTQREVFEAYSANLRRALGPSTYHDDPDPKKRHLRFDSTNVDHNVDDRRVVDARLIREWNDFEREIHGQFARKD